MTHTQQRKIAELLISKLNAAKNKPFEEITSHEEIQAEIQSKMVLAGVVYELIRDAWSDGVHNGRWATVFDEKIEKGHFDNFLNNLK
jgi:hypothetical protein